MGRKFTFYDYGPLRTYNATYNGCVGGRGLGKSYGMKKIMIADALENDRQFILLRRYKPELVEAKPTFFADVAKEFPGWDFRVEGRYAQAARSLDPVDGESDSDLTKRQKTQRWKTIGYFAALSVAQHMKGSSFPNVHTIMFDEFIIERGNLDYLPNEVVKFNNFYSTIDRWQDRVKVFFLANSVGIMNPYFLAWNIRPDEEKEFVKRNDGFIVFHFPDSEKFQSEVYQTRFGRFIAGTEYAEYAVGNQFADNHDHLIKLKDYRATYLFSLETKHGIFSLWEAREDGVSRFGAKTTYYAQKKRPKVDVLFTLLPEKMNNDRVLMTYRDRPMETLRTAFRTGNLMFDEASTRNTFIDIFDRK